MSVFHFSYDVKNSDKTTNEAFLKEFVSFLSDNFSASKITRPVESTILFSTSRAYKDIKDQITKEFSRTVYFVLSQVAKFEQETYSRCYQLKNEQLDLNFQEKIRPQRTK